MKKSLMLLIPHVLLRIYKFHAFPNRANKEDFEAPDRSVSSH
jgi:hypothetical protein